jgi:hypothetical protein
MNDAEKLCDSAAVTRRALMQPRLTFVMDGPGTRARQVGTPLAPRRSYAPGASNDESPSLRAFLSSGISETAKSGYEPDDAWQVLWSLHRLGANSLWANGNP